MFGPVIVALLGALIATISFAFALHLMGMGTMEGRNFRNYIRAMFGMVVGGFVSLGGLLWLGIVLFS